MSSASDRLTRYLAAEQTIVERGQEVRLEGRMWRGADLAELRSAIAGLTRTVEEETTGKRSGIRFYTARTD
jgi:hypothetical protein